jgi:tetratricopeptide (TPR) repeat protein
VRAEQGDIDGATTLYRQAIWLQNLKAEESIETRLALAPMLLNADRLDQAETEIEQALHLQPYNATGYRLRGDLFQRRRDFSQAVSAYQRAFELDPTQIDVYVSLSTLLREYGGRPAGILEVLQTATRLNPDEATLYLALGDQYQEIGDLASAISSYQLALEKFERYQLSAQLHPRSNDQSRAFTYSRLARAYEATGRLEPALHYYRAALAISPDVSWIHAMLGNLYRRRDDDEAAEAAYRRAIELDSTYMTASLGLAELYIDRARYDEAETILVDVMNEDPESVEGLVRLGELEQRRGNQEKALGWYRQATSEPIDNQPVNITLISSLLQYNDFDTALAYVQKAVSRRPDDGELLLQFGRIERTLGHYDSAESAFLKAQQSLPADSRL